MSATKAKKRSAEDEAYAPKKVDARPNNQLARCRPRHDRVVVRRDTASTVTKGGIHVPESAVQSKQLTGTVYATGPKVEGLKEGDRVIITGYAGLDLVDPNATRDDEFVLLRDEDVVAVLED